MADCVTWLGCGRSGTSARLISTQTARKPISIHRDFLPCPDPFPAKPAETHCHGFSLGWLKRRAETHFSLGFSPRLARGGLLKEGLKVSSNESQLRRLSLLKSLCFLIV